MVIGGMMRSGSTFSFNIAREVLPRSGVVGSASDNTFGSLTGDDQSWHFTVKSRAPEQDVTEQVLASRAWTICTVRKPEDSVVSWARSFGFSLDEGAAGVKSQLHWYPTVSSCVMTIDYRAKDSNPRAVIEKIKKYLVVPVIRCELPQYVDDGQLMVVGARSLPLIAGAKEPLEQYRS